MNRSIAFCLSAKDNRNNSISNHTFIQIHMLNTCGSNYRFNTLPSKLLVALNCVTFLVAVSFLFIL